MSPPGRHITDNIRPMHRPSRSAALGLLVAVALSSATEAEAGDRIRLDRQRAEFSANFFAITHGSPLEQERHINCRKRLALNLRRCRVSWESGRYASRARLLIAAFAGSADSNRYRVTYTLRRLDLRCAAQLPVEECTSIDRGRETYTGS